MRRDGVGCVIVTLIVTQLESNAGRHSRETWMTHAICVWPVGECWIQLASELRIRRRVRREHLGLLLPGCLAHLNLAERCVIHKANIYHTSVTSSID